MNVKRLIAVVLASGFAGVALWAQARGGGSEWLTSGADAQRTSWIRTDAAISVQSMSKPGFELQWKAALDNQSRGSSGLSQGVTANGVTLFIPMSLVTGSSNNVYAIDNDTGYTVWQRHFDAPLPAAASAACPGGFTAAATRIVAVAPPAPPRGGGGGGGGGRAAAGYRGGVGEPGQGIPAEFAGRAGGAGAARGAAAGATGAAGAAAAAATPPDPARAGGAGASTPPPDPARGAGAAPPNPARGAGAAPADPARAGGTGAAAPGAAPGGAGRGAAANAGIPGAAGGGGTGSGFGRPAGVVYVVSSDGVLHVLGLASGKDLQKPALFLPPNARWSDPIAVGETMYAATSQNCGGAPHGIWAIDLAGENKAVTPWTTNGGGIVGALAFATDGTLVAAIGPGPASPGGYSNAIVALDAKTLHVKDWFTSPTTEFASGPLVFKRNDKDIIAAATRDGRVLLLDATSLGGSNHATPLYASRPLTSTPSTFAPEALAMWQEMVPVPNPPAAAGASAGTAAATGATASAAGAPAGATPPPPPAPAMQPGAQWLLLPVAGPLHAEGTFPLNTSAIVNGAIVALKVLDDGAGMLSLQPTWVSRDLTSPMTPLIVNGVVFAVSRGRSAPPAAAVATAGDPARRPTPAVIYAMNGVDGKEFWSSGTTITSYLPGRSFWSANGQVYVGTADSAVYAFGFAMERK